MKNKVWYYQSGPKSVSINPYGIPEPPKPLRNCQSLDWAQKTKKFESLAEILTFLKTRHGCKVHASFRTAGTVGSEHFNGIAPLWR